eukprot:TRINITY_DN84754_c0_g1_i1.p1 TRINITY_DN84754_c0_g1~~TRINITY_DN84754_c0_g1_i1.p1  ORF type:complete len:361 (-),score=96.75 TRINITY_DN84754_c0_g1_i1:18-1100(-)
MADAVISGLKAVFGAYNAYKGKLAEIAAVSADAAELNERVAMLEVSVNSRITEQTLESMKDVSVDPLDSTIKKMQQIVDYVKKVEAFGRKYQGKTNLQMVFGAIAGQAVGSLPEDMQPVASAVFGELGQLPKNKFKEFESELGFRMGALQLWVSVNKPGGNKDPSQQAQLVEQISTMMTEDAKQADGDVYCVLIRDNPLQMLTTWVVMIGAGTEEERAYWLGVRSKKDTAVIQVNYFLLPRAGEIENEDLKYIGSGWFLTYSDGIRSYLDKQKTNNREYYQECMKFLKMPIPYGDEMCPCKVPEKQGGHVYNRRHFSKICGCCRMQEEFECTLKTQSGLLNLKAANDRSYITVNGSTWYA